MKSNLSLYDLLTIQIELTTYCNSSCIGCARNNQGGAVHPWLPLIHIDLGVWDKIVEQKSSEDIEFINIDVDKDTTGLAAQYKVTNIPHTVVISEGGDTVEKGGRLNEQELLELLN